MARWPNFELAELLRDEIRSGAFDGCALLPGERTLAERYGVGRGALRTALRRLQTEGVLVAVPRRGIRVAARGAKPRFRRLVLRCGNAPAGDSYEFIALLSGICRAAAERHAEVILSVAPAPFEAERLIENFRSGEIQGVIMAETLQGEAPRRLASAGVPLVVANCEEECAAVVSRMDFRAVGRLAGRRIAATGCREVGVLTGNLKSFIFREMLAGFRGALAEEEIALPKKWICEAPVRGGDAVAAELKKILVVGRHPRVWFAMRDIRAAHLCAAADELGLRIPEDIGIIGYDNVSWPEAKARGLTTISQPVAAIGAGAVRLLAEWFAAGKPPADLVFDGGLIERRSLPELPPPAR